jgi:hypothetical protein
MILIETLAKLFLEHIEIGHCYNEKYFVIHRFKRECYRALKVGKWRMLW